MEQVRKQRRTEQVKKKIIWLPKYVVPFEPVQLRCKHMFVKDLNDYMREPVTRYFLTSNLPVDDGPLKIGDLVWSKLANSPYWPAMVSLEPNRAQHLRIPPGLRCIIIYKFLITIFVRCPLYII